jgi:hypothetical protein
LEWLTAFFKGRRSALSRSFIPWQRTNRVQLYITGDELPWGYGGVLEVNRAIVSWLRTRCWRRTSSGSRLAGPSRHHALLECSAVLIAVRVWMPRWSSLPPSRAALDSGTGSLREAVSDDSGQSAVVRELALTVAGERCPVEALRLVEGLFSAPADILSREAEACQT